jgi:hypothetical protein
LREFATNLLHVRRMVRHEEERLRPRRDVLLETATYGLAQPSLRGLDMEARVAAKAAQLLHDGARGGALATAVDAFEGDEAALAHGLLKSLAPLQGSPWLSP